MVSDNYGLSRERIAKAFGMVPNTVTAWVRVGKLKGYTVGDVKEFVANGNSAFRRRMKPMLDQLLEELEQEAIRTDTDIIKNDKPLDANEIVKGMTDAQRSFLCYAIDVAEKRAFKRLDLVEMRHELDDLRERIEKLEEGEVDK